ncbi:MAG: hypothetical protein QM768_19135 [Agriterribacter sp.]
MHRVDLYFEGEIFNIIIDIIKRDAGIIIYWCNIYGKQMERLYCIKIDDKPLMITSSTIIDPGFEKAVLNCIAEIEYANADNRFGKILQPC